MTEVASRPVVSHPLESLTAQEVSAACDALRADGRLAGRVCISSVALQEPAKEAVRQFAAGDPVPRLAKVVLYDRDIKALHEVVVDLVAGAVASDATIEGAQPPLMLEEYMQLADRLKADPRYVEALAKRGITDLENIQVDPWPAGNFGTDLDAEGRRLCRGVSFYRSSPDDNGYAFPIENLVAFIDYDTWELVELVDTGVVPLPTEHGRYDTSAAEERGQELRRPAPLEITQPDGPGFTLDGNLLTWERWSLRVSLFPFEGLVLHQVTWKDDDRERPILFRAGLGEMVVPYGSTQTNHWWKNAFDAGEIGLAKLTNSLRLGCDCKGEIHYLDGVQVDETGNVETVPNQICIHEEDFGILWKHWDFTSDTTEVRRSRRLVVSSIATVGNYEYAFYWYFYLDGTIEYQVKMTGILQTQAVESSAGAEQAVMIAPNLAAPHHQHIFCVRLDWDLDGGPAAVTEVDVEALEAGSANPFHNAFDTRRTTFRTEMEAQRNIDPAKSRTWLVESTSSRNRLGEPVAYKLMPGYSPTMLAGAGAAVRSRATFGTKNLWVTPFDENEMHAAGDYPYQHAGGDGLPKWTAKNRSIAAADIVMWHTFGATHIARPEDWPIMPVESVGFTLKPWGFFDRNPSLDLAPEEASCHSDPAGY